jgi:hypothetical protein
LIFCNGVSSWLKKSIRYQPIKGCLLSVCRLFVAHFPPHPPTKSQRMASSSWPIVKASVI